MAVNLLGTIKDGIPGSFAAMAGGFLGESGAATGAALTALLPVVLAAVARIGAAAGATRGVLAMLSNPSVDTAILPNLNGIFAAGGTQANSMLSAGSGLAASVFGAGLAPLTAALGSVSGLSKPGSAQKLVALVVPVALAFLKRYVAANALSADALASLLAGQRRFLDGAIDGRLTTALGYADPAAMLSSLPPETAERREVAVGSAAAASTAPVEPRRAGRTGFAQWWPWLAGAIVVLYVLSRLMILHEAPGTSPSPPPALPTSSAPTSSAPTSSAPTSSAPTSVTGGTDAGAAK